MRLLRNDMDQISQYCDVYNYFHHFMLNHTETANAWAFQVQTINQHYHWQLRYEKL